MTKASEEAKAEGAKEEAEGVEKVVGKAADLGGKLLCQWKPNDAGPELLVMRGDLTACKADAIVNAANTHLMHGGGLAGAIVRVGGSSIQKESSAWIQQHGAMSVGDAVTTAAGKLPCKHVIHTAGPNIGHRSPTTENAAELRRAVWNALSEADRLGLSSVAVPGISTGIFGYPRDLGALEIMREAVRFCTERPSTPLRRIAFMNIDDPTVSSFVKALEEVKAHKTAATEDAAAGKEDEAISEKLSALDIKERVH